MSSKPKQHLNIAVPFATVGHFSRPSRRLAKVGMKKLFLTLFMLVAAAAFAQTSPSLTSEQIAIFKSILPPDATLTQEAHDRFWSPFDTRNISPAELNDIRDSIRALLAADLGRQRAMWMSMRDSLVAKRRLIHPDYAKANDMLRKQIVSRGGKTDKLDAEITAFEHQLELVVAGKPLHRGDREVVIDIPLVENVLAGMDESYRRAERLFDPQWLP